MKELNQLINTQICVKIMVKHRRLDHNISNSLTRTSSLEMVCMFRKKLAIFKQVNKR